MANNNSNGVYIPIEDPNYPGRKTNYKFYKYEELEQLSKKLGLKKSIAETIIHNNQSYQEVGVKKDVYEKLDFVQGDSGVKTTFKSKYLLDKDGNSVNFDFEFNYGATCSLVTVLNLINLKNQKEGKPLMTEAGLINIILAKKDDNDPEWKKIGFSTNFGKVSYSTIRESLMALFEKQPPPDEILLELDYGNGLSDAKLSDEQKNNIEYALNAYYNSENDAYRNNIVATVSSRLGGSFYTGQQDELLNYFGIKCTQGTHQLTTQERFSNFLKEKLINGRGLILNTSSSILWGAERTGNINFDHVIQVLDVFYDPIDGVEYVRIGDSGESKNDNSTRVIPLEQLYNAVHNNLLQVGYLVTDEPIFDPGKNTNIAIVDHSINYYIKALERRIPIFKLLSPIRRIKTYYMSAIAHHDPLVLDLDGDGIETIKLNDSNVYFDLDNDGFKEKSGWVSKDDGILIVDENNNGLVDGVSELFGNTTINGFDELKLSDSNNDGKIDSQDANFSKIKIWQDLNENGISEMGKFNTLSKKFAA